MPKGTKRKPDSLPTGQTLKVKPSDVAISDDLSTIDVGQDFVKQGETAQIGH